jgi:hypothetical protein
MILREDIQKKYSGLSTGELLAIVREKEGYTEMAISVAQEELTKRNITDDQVREFDERVEEDNAVVLQKAREDLGIFQKCFFYFIWVPLLHFPVKQNLREDGYFLKVRQAGYYSLAGFITFVITAFVSIALDLSDWPALLVWILLILLAFGLDNFFNKKRTSF